MRESLDQMMETQFLFEVKKLRRIALRERKRRIKGEEKEKKRKIQKEKGSKGEGKTLQTVQGLTFNFKVRKYF